MISPIFLIFRHAQRCVVDSGLSAVLVDDATREAGLKALGYYHQKRDAQRDVSSMVRHSTFLLVNALPSPLSLRIL